MRYAYAIRRKSDGKFMVSNPGGHTWHNYPSIMQLRSDELIAQKMCITIQLNIPELRDNLEVCKVTLSWEDNRNYFLPLASNDA